MNLVENIADIHKYVIKYAFLIAEVISVPTPELFEHAINSKHYNEWKHAMNEEIESMKVNNTWTIVPKPKNVRLIGNKWVYKVKESQNSTDSPRF